MVRSRLVISTELFKTFVDYSCLNVAVLCLFLLLSVMLYT